MDDTEGLRLLVYVDPWAEPRRFEPGVRLNLLGRAIVRLDVWVWKIRSFLFGDSLMLRSMAEHAYMHWIVGLCCVL